LGLNVVKRTLILPQQPTAVLKFRKENYMIRTKIVCTIGPASWEPQMLRTLIQAGMDVCRLNMSHADHATHAESIRKIREAAAEMNKPVAILADLQGPKLRIGEIANGAIEIEAGERVTLTTNDITGERNPPGGEVAAVIPVRYEYLPQDVKPGERILIDDGLIELQVLGVNGPNIFCTVINGGPISNHKGVNLPGTNLSIPSITDKDWEDLEFVLQQNVDWVALSFVRSGEEIIRLKEFMLDKCDPMCPVRVIAKIEKPQALEHMDQIIAVADAIMVARGDLGIEIPPQRVPLVQKQLIRAANAAGKPVITATQMLDSMVRNPRPTRAEASDVANAILDGTDAIMLSGETATGKYPLEAVRTMVDIAQEVEKALLGEEWNPPDYVERAARDVTDAVSHATCETADALHAAAIVTATASGRTARAVAKFRPRAPIIATTPHEIVQRQLILSWGVFPMLSTEVSRISRIIRQSIDLAMKSGLVQEGNRVVITAGVANSLPGMTNLMTVEMVRPPEETPDDDADDTWQ
jgi:pyruvate kinase